MAQKSILIAGLIAFSLAACSNVPRIVTEYRIDVQQGNVLTQEMVSQLRPGLTRDQVRFILGTPLLTDIFHAERWDYVFRLQDGVTNEVTSRNFSVFFDANGLLTSVKGDVDVATVAELTAPVARTQLVDLGSLGADAQPLPPPVDEKGFLGRMMETLGL
ncbi:MAG: outer membrane protein assembly factor BamE [Azovibrio sp.]|uniref:outer membrane protein assembly factor BamE n=1 Tax=Azovibrio sp. TaxID=1872673 RepID=UPI003C791E2C